MATGSRSLNLRNYTSPALPAELPYDFLKKITNDFGEDREISESLFGKLYKGIVPDDDKVIAVRKLGENGPIAPEKVFIREVQNTLCLRHENIVQLVGFCSERSKKLVQIDRRYVQVDISESLLCYEYLPMGSLQENLFGKKEAAGASQAKPNIDWGTRFKIIMGICQGLQFLKDVPIIHTNLKPESILLDINMVPKIADFMHSEIGDEQTRLSSQTVAAS